MGLNAFLVIAELSFEQSFAVIVSMLLCATFSYTRVKYGDMVVTHLTTRPYQLALVLLTVALFECIFLLIKANVIYAGNFEGLIAHWVASKTFKVTFMGFETLKYCCIIHFVHIQGFQYQILNAFVKFQHIFRVEELHIEKHRYQKLETNLLKYHTFRSYIIFIIWLIFILAAIISPDCYMIISLQLLAVLFAIVGTTRDYLSQGVQLIRSMYNYHKLEYLNHRYRLVTKIVVTALCASGLFICLTMGFYTTFCLSQVDEESSVPQAF